VIAVGSPEGLQSSVSIGVVSSTNRQVTPDGHLSYVQTDAAINPGNSGGALVDIQGKLVGINSFFFTEGGGSDGLGFAIPSRLVQFVYQSIRQNGRVPWGDTGVRVQGITHTLATGLHLARKSGVVVADVIPGTPAERLGIKVGDIIASLDEQPLDMSLSIRKRCITRQSVRASCSVFSGSQSWLTSEFPLSFRRPKIKAAALH
jgi:serine protease Do